MGLPLKIKPEKLQLSIGNAPVSLGTSIKSGGGVVVAIEDSQQLQHYLIESKKQNKSIEGTLFVEGEFDNTAKPYSIRLDDLLIELKTYYSAYRFLSEINEVVQPIDNVIVSDVQKAIDNMAMILFESTTKEHTMLFEKYEKSPDIFVKLNYGIIPIDLINQIQKALVSLCDRLNIVQKKLFEMAFQ